MSDDVIGIDLGTTNSCVAYTDPNGVTHTIAGTDGNRIVPSVVYFPQGSDPVVGDRARQYATMEPGRVAALFKRGMGEGSFLDDGKAFEVDGKVWSPEELSSLVLRKLKAMADEHLGRPVTKAVITVPAYFGEPERAATRDAGEIAGLTVLRIVNEPTAAAIAHGVDQASTAGRALVFDLGGGTFDVTVMSRGDDSGLTVVATAGDHRLGGADFDRMIYQRITETVLAEAGVDLETDPWAKAEAWAKAEEIKKELSVTDSCSRPISTGARPVMFTLTRDDFNTMIAPVVADIEDTIVYTLSEKNDPDLTATIDTVLMVGGSSRIPRFADLLTRLTGRTPTFSRNLDEDVARGASILAATVSGTIDPRNQLALMPVPVDAASHGLGLKVLDQPTGQLINRVLIPSGTPLPTQAEEMFATGAANQATVEVRLNEGDETDLQFVRELGKTVGRFQAPVPKGHPVRIVMSYTDDQMIEVTAFDGDSGAHLCDLKIEHAGLLSTAEKHEATSLLATMNVA